MPKTNPDATLASPFRHCTSIFPTKCRYFPTLCELRAHGKQRQPLSLCTNETLPQNAKAVCAFDDQTHGIFMRYESIAQ